MSSTHWHLIWFIIFLRRVSFSGNENFTWNIHRSCSPRLFESFVFLVLLIWLVLDNFDFNLFILILLLLVKIHHLFLLFGFLVLHLLKVHLSLDIDLLLHQILCCLLSNKTVMHCSYGFWTLFHHLRLIHLRAERPNLSYLCKLSLRHGNSLMMAIKWLIHFILNAHLRQS